MPDVVDVGRGVNPARCWFCGSEDVKHVVAEVWFDFGIPNVRFCSTQDLKGPKPRVCGSCYGKREAELATTMLNHFAATGGLGPLVPTRWWVRYEGEPSFDSPAFKPFGGFVGRAGPGQGAA